MVTMKDVAAHAGVSVMTVSNVVNNKPGVLAETRERVVLAIAELGYQVNVTARQLRQGKSGVIGLAVPEIDQPYFGQLAQNLQREAVEAGYSLVIEQTGASRDQELTTLLNSRLRSYDGLILAAVSLADRDASLLRGPYPLVILGEREYAEPVDQVVMANFEGGELATNHLLRTGAKNIAIIGGTRGEVEAKNVNSTRTAGYRAALRAAGSQVREAHIVELDRMSMEASTQATAQLLTAYPEIDALFCVTDVIAIGALKAAHNLGMDVPGQLEIIGFDDVPIASFLTPGLTTIAPDHEFIAQEAIKMLVGRIEGVRPVGSYAQAIAPVKLEARGSTRESS